MMKAVTNILFSMSFQKPCPCIQDITIPQSFLIKQIAEVNYRNKDTHEEYNCLKNILSRYLITENFYNIWIAEHFLDSDVVFSNQLERSVTIRNLCGLTYEHNLGDPYYCYKYLMILVLEARNYLKAVFETPSKENAVISFYVKEYELFKKNTLFEIYGSTLFATAINPILAFNLNLKETLCESVSVSNNILFIPYVNQHVISKVDFDPSIIKSHTHSSQ